MTVERSCRLAALAQIYVVTNAAYKFLALGQLEEPGYRFPEENLLLEPAAKNTLPAIYHGIKEIQKAHGDDVTAVFPSDHLLADGPEFAAAVQKSCSLAAGNTWSPTG